MDQKSTSMSSRRSETTAAMPSVTVGMLVIAVMPEVLASREPERAKHRICAWQPNTGELGR